MYPCTDTVTSLVVVAARAQVIMAQSIEQQKYLEHSLKMQREAQARAAVERRYFNKEFSAAIKNMAEEM